MITLNKNREGQIDDLTVSLSVDFDGLGLMQNALFKSLVDELNKPNNERNTGKAIMLASMLEEFMLSDGQMSALGWALKKLGQEDRSRFIEHFNPDPA